MACQVDISKSLSLIIDYIIRCDHQIGKISGHTSHHICHRLRRDKSTEGLRWYLHGLCSLKFAFSVTSTLIKSLTRIMFQDVQLYLFSPFTIAPQWIKIIHIRRLVVSSLMTAKLLLWHSWTVGLFWAILSFFGMWIPFTNELITNFFCIRFYPRGRRLLLLLALTKLQLSNN